MCDIGILLGGDYGAMTRAKRKHTQTEHPKEFAKLRVGGHERSKDIVRRIEETKAKRADAKDLVVILAAKKEKGHDIITFSNPDKTAYRGGKQQKGIHTRFKVFFCMKCGKTGMGGPCKLTRKFRSQDCKPRETNRGSTPRRRMERWKKYLSSDTNKKEHPENYECVRIAYKKLVEVEEDWMTRRKENEKAPKRARILARRKATAAKTKALQKSGASKTVIKKMAKEYMKSWGKTKKQIQARKEREAYYKRKGWKCGPTRVVAKKMKNYIAASNVTKHQAGLPLGRKREKNEGGGNCLPASIAQGLNALLRASWGGGSWVPPSRMADAKSVRGSIVQELCRKEEGRVMYGDFWEKSGLLGEENLETGSYDEYVADLKKDGRWMGEREICAAAEKFKVRIVVLAGAAMRIYKSDISDTIFLWYKDRHYENCPGGTKQMDDSFIEKEKERRAEDEGKAIQSSRKTAVATGSRKGRAAGGQ